MVIKATDSNIGTKTISTSRRLYKTDNIFNKLDERLNIGNSMNKGVDFKLTLSKADLSKKRVELI